MPKDFKGVMREFGSGKLHSGSKHGRVVTNPKQAQAIAFGEQRAMRRHNPIHNLGKFAHPPKRHR